MQNVQPTSNIGLSDPQRHFIDEMAALLMPMGMTATAARLYAYLQLRNEPASLDEIAADLEVSKSNASTAARMLEELGNARRLGTRGSKRVLYAAGPAPGVPMRRQTALLGLMSELILRSKDTVADGVANRRLEHLAEFHRDLRNAIEAVVGAARTRAPG